MQEIRVGIIGCGRSRQQAGATGYGMAHAHAAGYEAHPRARIVALADINLENAADFQQEHGGERLYAS
jgi:predicted dehydrogenase